MRKSLYLWVALLVLLGAWLISGVRQVEMGQRAVVRRFGRVLEHRPGPGLHFGFPLGIDRFDPVNIELGRAVKIGFVNRDSESNTIPPGQMLTGDHNLINIELQIHYSVAEDEVVDYVMNSERVESLLARTAEAVLSEWVAGRKVDNIWGRKELPGPAFVGEVQRRITDYRLGIRIREANVSHLAPPDEVKSAFDEVSRAKASIETLINEAEQQTNSQERDAEAAAKHIERMALAYENEQLLLAHAERDNFDSRRKQYQQHTKANPNYLNALWWDEMSRLYKNMRQTGRIDLLDNRLGADGLDITQFPPLRKK